MQITESELWAALETAVGPAIRRDRPFGSVTAKEYADQYGIARKTASEILNKAVAEGKLSSEVVLIDSRLHKVYTPCSPMIAQQPMARRSAR